MTPDPCQAALQLIANSNLPASVKATLTAAVRAACSSRNFSKWMDYSGSSTLVGNCSGVTYPCYDAMEP